MNTYFVAEKSGKGEWFQIYRVRGAIETLVLDLLPNARNASDIAFQMTLNQ